MRHFSPAYALLSLGSLFLLIGCGTSLPHTSLTSTPAATFSGRVHGGEQPVSGAVIQLYTVGTNGDGSPATPLIAGIVHTDAYGNFNITGTYSCTAATEVYLLATGGDPGLGAPNPNLALMTALGPCTDLTPYTYISVNELTTVAAVYSLSAFMSSPTHVGAAPNNTAALYGAFNLAGRLVDPSTGRLQIASGAPPATAKIDTLADVLAACINTTGGVAGDTSVCGRLFSLARQSFGAPPTDTVSALLSIAQNPLQNVPQLYQLAASIAPYQPTAPSAPVDFSIQGTPSANAASALQIGPSSLTFPSASLGVTTLPETVVITNPTSAAVALNAITFTGTNPADFAQTNTCGTTLAPSASCTVAITFTPVGSSTRSASLSIASATPDSPQLVALAGNTTSTVINGPHATVDHPIVRIYPGASYDIALSNTGNAPLAISSIALAATPFNTQTNNCPPTLPTGASCTVSIHSIAAGADQLTIVTNDQSFSSDILIFPSPNAPSAVFTPSNLLFADTAVGSNNQSRYTYNASAVVTPTISGPQASEFSATAPACTNGQYPTTAPSCSFTITFAPSAIGFRSAQLALDSSGNYVPLAGIGKNSTHNSYSALSLRYFPYYPIPQFGYLINTGPTAMPVPTFGIQSVTGEPEFTERDDCGTSLLPQAHCTVTVYTSRRTEGGTQALLTISSGTDVYTLPLDNSVYPVLDFGETAYSSAPAASGQTYPIPGPFNNYGFSSFFASSLIESPQVFSFSECSVGPAICVGEAIYKPTQPGMQVATFTLASAGPFWLPAGTNLSVQQYILVGTGTPTEPAAKLLLKQSGFTSFAGSNAYNPSTLTLINPGSHTVTLTAPALSGSAPQNFSLGQASCIQSPATSSTYPSIAAGALCTIPITYLSSQTGFSTANLTVTDTISGLTFTTPLYLDTLAGPTVSPSSLSFGATPVNTITAPQSVSVTRDITHPVTSTTYGGVVATKGSCAAGETPCILTFLFAPTTTGNYPSVKISDSTLASVTDLPVSGTPLPAVVHSSALASPGYLSFANQAVGATPVTHTITLTSGGPGDLTVYSITLAGGGASAFTQTNNCGTALPVNASCTITVSFAPHTAGTESDQLVINGSSNTGYPLTVPLYGVAH